MTGKANADVEMHVHQASALAAIEALGNRIDRMMEGTTRGTRRQTKAAEETTSELDKWAQKIQKTITSSLTLAGVFTGVHKVIELARMELDAVLQKAQAARDMQLPLNEQMEAINTNLPPETDMSLDDIYKAIMQSPAKDKASLARAIKSTISAGLTEPVSDRVEAALKAVEFAPGLLSSDPEEFRSLVEAAMVAKRAHPGPVEEKIGAMFNAASAARPTTIGQFSRTIGGLVPMLKQFGFTEKEALAFGSSMSIAMNDTTGETSATNSYIFLSQMVTELGKIGRQDLKGQKMLDFLKSNDPAANDLRNRMVSFLQSDLTPEEAADLAAGKLDPKIHGKARGKVAVMQWMDPEGVPRGQEHIQSLFAAAMQNIKTGPEAAAWLNERVGDIRGKPWYQSTKMEYAWKGWEAGRLADPEEGVAGSLDELRANFAKLTNDWASKHWMLDKMAGVERAMAGTSAARELEIQAQRIRDRQAGLVEAATGQGMRTEGGPLGQARLTADIWGNTPAIQDVLEQMTNRDKSLFIGLETLIEEMRLVRENLERGIPVEQKNAPLQAPRAPAGGR